MLFGSNNLKYISKVLKASHFAVLFLQDFYYLALIK